MIITRPYFKGDIAISNTEDLAPNSNLLGNKTSLDRYITKYERVILVKLFGYDLYRLFSEQFDKDVSTGIWTLKTSADTKWGELLNGKEYQEDGIYHNWQGLIFGGCGADTEQYQSLIAYYIYAKFIENTEFTHSGVGMQREKSKNSTRVNARVKIVNALNEFYYLAIENEDGFESLYDFLSYSNSQDDTTYPNWNPSQEFTLKNRYI